MALKDRLYGVPVVGTALRVQDRYRDDAADQLAASIGFFAFLSLFPLIIMAVAVGGFVVRNTPGAEVDMVQAIRDAIPGLAGLGGTDLEDLVSDVAGRAGTILGVGAVTLLLTGLRVINGAMVATTRVFRMAQPVGVKGWLRKLGALLLLGTLALGGAAAVGVVGIDVEAVPRPVSVILGLGVAFAFDLVLFLVAYRILAASEGPRWRELLPGAVLAATGWVALKSFGATWVASQAAKANELYGTLGGIIALLLLFYLAGRLYLYGAELSAHLCERGRPEGDGTVVAPVSAAAVHEAEPRPPPPPGRRLAATEPSRAVSDVTRQRLAAAQPDRSDRGADLRHAVAFTLAIGAVAGVLYATKPWESDG